MSNQITQLVHNCQVCAKETLPRTEPLISPPLPEYLWQVIGTDLFEFKGLHYLIAIDYFSRYPEVTKLASLSSEGTIAALKAIFARHAIPEIVRSDNGTQYSSDAFREFATVYGFCHLTSSPHYPKSNGLVERAVRSIKKLLRCSTDPQLALLAYRAIPLPWCRLSPAQLLMGRHIRTSMPQTLEHLKPHLEVPSSIRRGGQNR